MPRPKAEHVIDVLERSLDQFAEEYRRLPPEKQVARGIEVPVRVELLRGAFLIVAQLKHIR